MSDATDRNALDPYHTGPEWRSFELLRFRALLRHRELGLAKLVFEDKHGQPVEFTMPLATFRAAVADWLRGEVELSPRPSDATGGNTLSLGSATAGTPMIWCDRIEPQEKGDE